MILLSGHSLTAARKVPLESMQLTLKERDSTASMVPADMTGISVNSWLQDDTNPGKNIVWRVKSIRQAYNSSTNTVSLEHAIGILRDTLLFGEVTTATLAGKKSATEVTAKKAVQYILSQSADWTLGSFDYTDSNPYKFDGESLYDALETITDSLEDAVWTYTFTSYPFKLNITKRNTSVDSELRANRNLRTITRTVDMSGMYTRFYPIGKEDLHIKGDYVEKNTATYGVISRVETDQSLDTTAELKRWANERLKKHAKPTVTIDVEGFELADATGEPLDRLTLDRVCRIPLPEFSTTITERITALNYPDKVKQPEVVKITLANNRTDVTKIIADAIKRSGKGSRTSTKKGAEDRAWFEDTNDHVAMCAKGIIGTDAKGNPNWERLSKLVVDGNGISQTVTDIQGDVKKHETRIKQTEKSIGLVVGTYSSGGNYIKAGEIVLAINNDNSSTAKIRADKILLEGTTRLNDVLTVSQGYAWFKKPVVFGSNLFKTNINNGIINTMVGINYFASAGTFHYNLSYETLGLMIKTAESVGSNTIRLTRWNGTYVDFSRAISSWVWGGGDGKINVTALPQNQKKSVKVSIDGRNTITTNGEYTYTVDYENADGDDVSTEATKTVTVNVPTTSYTSKTLTCTDVQATYPGSSTNYYYFRLEGRYSFSKNSNYTMYRTSW